MAISDSSCLCAVQPSSSFRGNRSRYKCYAAATPTSFPLPTHQSHRHRQSNRITRKANCKDSTKGETRARNPSISSHTWNAHQGSLQTWYSHVSQAHPSIHGDTHHPYLGSPRPTSPLPRAASCIGHITLVCCPSHRARSRTDRRTPTGVLLFSGDRNLDMEFLYALLKERERGD